MTVETAEGATVPESERAAAGGRALAVLTAVESVRTSPTSRTVFAHAKIMHVMSGTALVETAHGSRRLTPGMSLALGKGHWCRVMPQSRVRLWTIYTDEEFLRAQMAWFLPDERRVHPGVHPHQWDGGVIVIDPGTVALRQIEPLWRQMSVLHADTQEPELVAARTVELFARWIGIVLPSFLTTEPRLRPLRAPINGHLTDSSAVGQLGRAMTLLRERMDQHWTVAALAREVALSRTHLTRLFALHAGAAPMRFLTEIRLTEFVRLIEETDLSIAHAANAVGWSDPRVASTWFHRRFGITPSRYRLTAHPHCVLPRGCRGSCAGDCAG